MRIARLVTAAVAATVVAVVSTGAPALAHNSLTKAAPAKNATIKESPAAVELSFLEEPLQLTIEVTDAQQQKTAASGPSVKGKTGTLTLTGPLANGTYTVRWSLVSDDGDPIKGTYKFTVDGPATTSPAPSPSPTVSPAPPAPAVTSAAATPVADSSDSSSSGWIIAIIAVVLVGAAGAIFLARRRRTTE